MVNHEAVDEGIDLVCSDPQVAMSHLRAVLNRATFGRYLRTTESLGALKAADRKKVVQLLLPCVKDSRDFREALALKMVGCTPPIVRSALLRNVDDLRETLDGLHADLGREEAAAALGQMGPAASKALPELERLSVTGCIELRRASRIALRRIRK